MRRLLIASVLLPAVAFAQQPAQRRATAPKPVAHAAFPTGEATPLGSKITALLADPSVSRAHWGIAVTALDGKPIYGLDEGKLFRPASNAKLFTTAAAMALMGPEKTVTTRVEFPPPAADGTVQGDVTLIGGGDANLSGRLVPYVPLASPAAKEPTLDPLRAMDDFAVRMGAAGVRHVTGGVVGSDAPWEPYPQGWGTDDLLWGYGAPVSGLVVDDNEVLLKVKPGSKKGDAAKVSLLPDVGYYKIASTVSTVDGKKSDVAIHREAGERTLHVDGAVGLSGSYSTEIAVDDPPAYAATALRIKLLEHGIAVDGVASAPHEPAGNPDDFLRESREPIELEAAVAAYFPGSCIAPCPPAPVDLKRTSPTLADDVSVTLKDSQNLHAEMMLRRLGAEFNIILPGVLGDSTFAQGARVVRQFLIDAGLDPDDFIFYDGSGLSAKDLVTPRATAQLLTYATKQPWFAQWKAALPIGGVDGTLASRFTTAPLKGHVFAKTGTLGESRALSGYLDCASGRQVIFSIMVDNHTPAGSADRATMDKIVAVIAAEN